MAAPHNSPPPDQPGPPVPAKSVPTVISKDSDHPAYIKPPSRTSSQKKALNHFAKELQRYADITSAPGKRADFSPTTICPTPLSLHTVEALLPYRDEFLAAGLAVTSADQRSPEGKGKEVAELDNGVSRRPIHTQLDGSPRGRAPTTSSSPSSGETSIHFNDNPDPVALALIEELPGRKQSVKSSREKTQSRWFHRQKNHGAIGGPADFIFPKQKKPSPPQTYSPKRPRSHTAPQLPERSRQREDKVLEGTGQSAPVPTRPRRPSRPLDSKKAGKLPELPEDIQWRSPKRPDRAPPVPPKVTVSNEKPTSSHSQTHKPSGIRPAGSTVDAPHRKKSPSHVRNRHVPLEKPVSKWELSAPFVQPTEELMLAAGHPGHHGPPADKSIKRSKVLRDKGDIAKPLPTAIVDHIVEQPTDALILQAGHPGRHGPTLAQEPAALRDNSNCISLTPPIIVKHTGGSTPELPMTWKYAVGTPLSFEQALDNVVRKLDEMEPKPKPLTVENLRAAEEIHPAPQSERPKQHPGLSRHQLEPRSTLDKLSAKVTDILGAAAYEITAELEKAPAKASGLLETTAQKVHDKLHKPPASKAPLSPDSKLHRAMVMRRGRRDEEKEGHQAEAVSAEPAPAKPAPPKLAAVAAKPDAPEAMEDTKDHSKSPPNTSKPQQPQPHHPAPKPPSKSTALANKDTDIPDRDVLKGLKLAVQAACDENLDFWIRQRTGLRLRRFLADLKTFEDLDASHLDLLNVDPLESHKRGEHGNEGKAYFGGGSNLGTISEKTEKTSRADNGKGKAAGPKTGRDGADEQDDQEEEGELGDDEAERVDRDKQRDERRAKRLRADRERELERLRREYEGAGE
ncbi:hypothetical protein GE09DRAFT_1212329 [Coniochaeta sp. 2T2.1]|nr:hypothetical protein GE09DRAFT_1212329 [Coniochaeta sp. 2T2.1]